MKIYPPLVEFSKVNAVFFKLTDEEISPLNKEASNIKQKIDQSLDKDLDAICYGKHLAGHLQHQYFLSETTGTYIESMMLPVVREYISRYENDVYFSIENLTFGLQMKDNKCWINFQKKHEYNPIHCHSGLFSFVIWLNIPYHRENESRQSNVVKKQDPNQSTNGDFQFFIRGEKHIVPVPLGIDKRWEGRGVLFASNLAHAVYPFYTSDDYRISISGNFRVK